MKFDYLEDGKSIQYKLVGSRVTCDPAPSDTDQDVLVLVNNEQLCYLLSYCGNNGFILDGSCVEDSAQYLKENGRFQSFTKDKINLIITTDNVFYQRFKAATFIAKKLNLLQKQDRIDLFQAVLYANTPDSQINLTEALS